jgi:transcriptional regulator with XRE-family HTH domain
VGKYDPAPTAASGLLRLARDKAGLTQHELASRAGVSQQAISSYETGRKEPTFTTVDRLLEAAGFEMRIRLEPLDDHDRSLEAFVESLPNEARAILEKSRRERAEAARLKRVRGR